MGNEGLTRACLENSLRVWFRGALLTGMGAEAPSVVYINRLGSTQCTLARGALGSNGSYESSQGRRQLSNDQVRVNMGLHTVASTLRARRLKWWQDLVTFPERKQTAACHFFGTMEREVRGHMYWYRPHGRTTSTRPATLWEHIQPWGTTMGQLTKQVKVMGGTVRLRDEWRDRYRVMNPEAIQTQQISEPKGTALGRHETEEVCGAIGANGDVCQFTGNNEQ